VGSAPPFSGTAVHSISRVVTRRERSSATLVVVTDVHQCPYCELRFVSRNELEDHVALDHPRSVDDDTDDVANRRAPGS
jgi:hypothetical protein